jgi:dienelactone hydrolase
MHARPGIFGSRSIRRHLFAAALMLAIFCPAAAPAAEIPTLLPQTAALDWPEEDLSGRMMDGAHRFVERQIGEARARRAGHWKYDASSPAAWDQALAQNRQLLAEILGITQARVAPRMERFGDDASPALVAETSQYRVYQVRWPVLDGLYGEGLLVQPRGEAKAHLVVVPDCNQTPEEVLGLAVGLAPERQFARLLAEAGCELVVPVLIERRPLETNDAQLKRSDQTPREWLYRQGYHLGRHLIGLEVQKVRSAVDWFEAQHGDSARIGVVGYAEGGLVALYAAALDTRIDATLVSGYFDSREQVWSEPIDRNIWSLLIRFGDAELASLVLPRHLVIEHAAIPEFTSSKGSLKTPAGSSVRSEFKRIPSVNALPKAVLIAGDGDSPVGPMSEAALAEFAGRLSFDFAPSAPGEAPLDQRRGFEARARQRRASEEMERHLQSLLRESEHIRERRFLYSVLPQLEKQPWSTDKRRPLQNAEQFLAGAKPFRERFSSEAMGRFDVPYLPLNPRSRKVAETEQWTAYDVVLDVWPDVFAWGVLVLPKDLKPGERRPVVVCQHGRNGVPLDCVNRHSTAYNDFAAKLAERGFITFAPHNLYRGEDRYRWLCRKANNVGGTLFSFILGQHERVLAWLSSLDCVDAERIAFYGLSYGGETAVRVPTILEGYCLSICSGDFNQWTTKVASTAEPWSFMRTIEWEMPYWKLGQTFDYAEMAYLMAPRPFMVERGHLDRVGRDEWVAHEYAKVRFLYSQLGLADRTQIEFFPGGHSINGQGTFAFLHKHLQWPTPEERTGQAEIRSDL